MKRRKFLKLIAAAAPALLPLRKSHLESASTTGAASDILPDLMVLQPVSPTTKWKTMYAAGQRVDKPLTLYQKYGYDIAMGADGVTGIVSPEEAQQLRLLPIGKERADESHA